jgi:hypothetical protein
MIARQRTSAARRSNLRFGLLLANRCSITATVVASARTRRKCPHGQLQSALNRDDILDNMTLYWLTNRYAASACRASVSGSASLPAHGLAEDPDVVLLSFYDFPGEHWSTSDPAAAPPGWRWCSSSSKQRKNGRAPSTDHIWARWSEPAQSSRKERSSNGHTRQTNVAA